MDHYNNLSHNCNTILIRIHSSSPPWSDQQQHIDPSPREHTHKMKQTMTPWNNQIHSSSSSSQRPTPSSSSSSSSPPPPIAATCSPSKKKRRSLLRNRYGSSPVSNPQSPPQLSSSFSSSCPFVFYWTRPLGAAESCRRMTLCVDSTTVRRRTAAAVWAVPLQDWTQVKDAIHGSTTTTLQLDGCSQDWLQFANHDSGRLWKEWIHLLVSHVQLSRVVFLLRRPQQQRQHESPSSHHNRHQQDTLDKEEDDTFHKDIVCRFLMDWTTAWSAQHASSSSVSSCCCPLRHVEFLDPAPLGAVRARLQLLSSSSYVALESIVWHAASGPLDDNRVVPQPHAAALTRAWLNVLTRHGVSLHSLTLQGPWQSILFGPPPWQNHTNPKKDDKGHKDHHMEEEEEDWLFWFLSFWHSLEQAPNLEHLELSSSLSWSSDEACLAHQAEVWLHNKVQHDPKPRTCTTRTNNDRNTTDPVSSSRISFRRPSSSSSSLLRLRSGADCSRTIVTPHAAGSTTLLPTAAAAAVASTGPLESSLSVPGYLHVLTQLHWIRRLYQEYHRWRTRSYQKCFKGSSLVNRGWVVSSAASNGAAKEEDETVGIVTRALTVVETWFRDTHCPPLLRHAAAQAEAAAASTTTRTTTKRTS